MRRLWVRAAAIALLGLMVGAAATGVAKASAALEHACCPRAATTDAAPSDDCHGFLPLSCCNTEALPASDVASVAHAIAAPAALSIALAVPISAPQRFASNGDVAARASPLRLSVVVQV